jgi:hypothetical protein
LLARSTFFGMLPFGLYFVAGVATGFHVYTLLALTVYGAPFNSLELVSLLGSVALLIAAFISLFKPYAAARIALIACLMTWSFYGPAIANVVRTKFDKHSAVSANPNNPRTQSFALVSR